MKITGLMSRIQSRYPSVLWLDRSDESEKAYSTYRPCFAKKWDEWMEETHEEMEWEEFRKMIMGRVETLWGKWDDSYEYDRAVSLFAAIDRHERWLKEQDLSSGL